MPMQTDRLVTWIIGGVVGFFFIVAVIPLIIGDDGLNGIKIAFQGGCHLSNMADTAGTLGDEVSATEFEQVVFSVGESFSNKGYFITQGAGPTSCTESLTGTAGRFTDDDWALDPAYGSIASYTENQVGMRFVGTALTNNPTTNIVVTLLNLAPLLLVGTLVFGVIAGFFTLRGRGLFGSSGGGGSRSGGFQG